MSFVPYDPACYFPIQNLPYGVFSRQKNPRRTLGVAIGNQVVDLAELAKAGIFSQAIASAFQQDSLNGFMALGKPAWQEARAQLTTLLSADASSLRDDHSLRQRAFVPQDEITMHLPARIGDYTDFYLSREHATNCGTMMRGASNALSPSWLSLPVAYHGRASTIVVSGTPVQRPWGQVLKDRQDPKSAALLPCRVLDFELEMGALVGHGNAMGEPIGIQDAEDAIFGLVLLNDWSARDIQMWEMAPLGPFNSKNWASSISPWVVTLEALQPFRCAAPVQEPPPLPYLALPGRHSYDIRLEAELLPAGRAQGTVVSRSNFRHLYWTLPQMVTHHTVGGCSLQPGDLLGTGTISCNAEGRAGVGCLLEKTYNGADPVELKGGGQRLFLEDGDTVVLRGYCQGEGYRVGFGECRGAVLPARAAS